MSTGKAALLTLREWAIINEALGVYVEHLRSDDDEDNNAIADEAEEILIPEGKWGY